MKAITQFHDTTQSSRDQDKFVVRMPKGMREAIKVAASARRLSMNNFIVEAISTLMADGNAVLPVFGTPVYSEVHGFGVIAGIAVQSKDTLEIRVNYSKDVKFYACTPDNMNLPFRVMPAICKG